MSTTVGLPPLARPASSRLRVPPGGLDHNWRDTQRQNEASGGAILISRRSDQRVAALAWQARGRRFKSAMLHRNSNSMLALSTYECQDLGALTTKLDH